MSSTALFDFSHIEDEVQEHLRDVYTVTALAVASMAVGAFIPINLEFQLTPVVGLLSLLLFIWLLVMIISLPQSSSTARLLCLMGLAFILGVDLVPLIKLATDVDPTIVPLAVTVTALCFIGFSLAATVGDTRSFLVLGGILCTALLYTLLLQILAVITNSGHLFMWALHIQLLLNICFILYDTQLIIHRRREGNTDHILHALMLVIDIVDLLRILIVLLIMLSNEAKQKVTTYFSRRPEPPPVNSTTQRR